jgi:surface-anchored protein
MLAFLPRFSLAAFAALFGLAAATAALHAQIYLSNGHTDLNLAYTQSNDTWGLYGHYRPAGIPPEVDVPVSDLVFFLGDTGGKFPTSGGILPFLGQTGQPVWILPQNQNANIPWVGFGAYGVGGTEAQPSDDLAVLDPLPALTGNAATPAVRITFLSALTPPNADFALWQTGPTTLHWSNRPGTTAPNFIALRRGQHAHFNWGFSQPGFYRIRLRLDGTIGGLPTTSQILNVTIAVSVLPAYEIWRRDGPRFTPAERDDLALSGPAADPDFDGLPNLLEYALGAEPRLADGPAFTPTFLTSAPTPTLRFNRVADPLLTYRVESSTDLVMWTVVGTSTGTANVAGPVEFADPAPLSPASPRRFLRLRVSHAE